VARRAWAREQDRVSGASPESWSAAWRDREVKTILAGSPGVEGWEAVYRRSPATWPQLASDLSNVAILRKQQRRGRH